VASFRGSFRHSIDEKCRLALPKPFRRIVGVKQRQGPGPVLVLTKGFNRCVAAYTEEDWPRYENRLREEAFTDQRSRDFVLELAEMTFDAPVDTVGRILIPSQHMQMAGFEKSMEIMILGVFDHFELWNPERYAEHLAKSEGTFEERAQNFFRGKAENGRSRLG
jgi:MraZ protein